MSFFQFCFFFLNRWFKKYKFFIKNKIYAVTENFLKPFFKENRFISVVKIFWPTRFSATDFFWVKAVYPFKKKINSLFLRKTKSFYKGRYARNRQTCRVIVFWTIALNLLFIYGLYFFFYQFTFNFGYFWWGLFFLYTSLIWSTILKNYFFSFYKICSEFLLFIRWLFFFFKGFFS